MPDSEAPGRGFLLAPRYLAWDDGHTLALLDVPGGDLLEFDGVLRDSIHAGSVTPSLQAAALLDASISELTASLRTARLVPLTRATMLRGAGYRQLFIELTAQCNESCVHCYADSSPQRQEALDEATVFEVIDDAAEIGFKQVQLTGGDPLISPVCLAAAKRVRQVGIPQLEVYTNGLALSGKLYEQLKRLEADFAFSFYSSSPQEHDEITQTPGSQQRTLEAIRRVNQDGLRNRVSIVVMEQNRESIEQTIACLGEVGVTRDRIGIDVQRTVGRGLMTIRRSETRLSRLSLVPDDEQQQPALPTAGHRSRDDVGFGGRAAVSYDGTVFPCIFTRSVPLGDVRKTRLTEILSDPRALRLDRAALFEGMSRHHEQLSCWECRLRASMLASSEGPSGE